MAHVHGAAGAAQIGKSAAKAAGHSMMGENMSGMMEKGMSGMIGEGMPGMMGKGLVATGAAATAKSHTARSVVGKILKHPLVLFGLGLAVGYTVHKYRKEIIGSANRVAEKGKDFVLQQRENLEDLVAETPESES